MGVWRVGLAFFIQYLKGMLAFRWDFWLNVGGIVLGQSLNLLTIGAIFQRIPNLQGWQFHQALLIYGMSQLSLNVFYVFGTALGSTNHLINDGQMDQFLVRPVDPLVQLLTHDIGVQQLTAAISSTGIITYSLWHLPQMPGWGPVALPIFVLGGAAIYLGLALLAASAAFWLQDRHGIVWPILSAGDTVSQYPITIFSPSVRIVITWVLPYAFTAFYPATVLMGIRTWFAYAWATPFVGLGLCLAGYRVWNLGLRRYSGTGS
jgi:ABC-2 type transport system permease protein